MPSRSRRFAAHPAYGESGGSGVSLPLLAVYIALIVYASLYPFVGWRNQGVAPWAFLLAPLPLYWSGFDVLINIAGYVPLGVLMAVWQRPTARFWPVVVRATLGAALLSMSMEALQTYLSPRVSSNLDLAWNTLGGLLGGLFARWGWLQAWARWRRQWFDAGAGWGLGLLLLWPLALLYPSPVPLGLGHVMERVEGWALAILAGTPYQDWWPLREIELQPLLPATEMFAVALGLLVPVLLAFALTRTLGMRLLALVMLFLSALLGSSLSVALEVGPEHAWVWLRPSVQMGLWLGLLLALGVVIAPTRWCWVFLLLCVALHIAWVNPAPLNPYLAQTRAAWEQGRFIRFYGLTQWLSMLWPYAVLLLGMAKLSKIR